MRDSPDYSRKWHVMLAVGTGIFLSTIDGSIVNVALPTLVRDLGSDFATVQWVVLAYLLTLTALIVGVGRLADMSGKKHIYASGFVVFAVGSLLCGLAPSVYWLIASRVLQGVGAAMLMALGMALVIEAFPPGERGRALGVSGAIVSVGIVVGPTLGGLIIYWLSWNWIFFVNLPVAVVGTALAVRYVPADRPSGGQHFDVLGAVLLTASLLCLLLGLTSGQRVGFGGPMVVALLTAWMGFTAAFLAVERRAREPMVDLTLFGNRAFNVGLVTGAITFVSIAGTILLMPFYLEDVLGYSTRNVGLLLAVVPLALGVVSPIAGSLSDRFGTPPIAFAGLCILLLGYAALAGLSVDTSAAGFVIRFLPIGIGMGTFQSPNNSAILGAAPRERLGVVSGLLGLTRTLGQTVGIALLGALWSGRVAVHAAVAFSGEPTAAPRHVQAAALHDTFVGIVVLIGVALVLAGWRLLPPHLLPALRRAHG